MLVKDAKHSLYTQETLTGARKKDRRNVARKEEDKWSRWDKRIRDLVIWIIGVGALMNELFVKKQPEPTTLIFLGGILGIPFILKADEIRRGDRK